MRRYFSSRRRVSEPEIPEPRFHWRTRVNSLMSEDDRKPTAKTSGQKYETSPLPIYPTHDSEKENNFHKENPEVTSQRSRFHIERRQTDESVEERKRDRFVRTNSDSRLKMRVRFPKEEFLESSRSLDTADENGDMPPDHWRTRHLRRSRSRDKSGTGSLDRSEGDISVDDDDSNDAYMGAFGCSYDSGLDLRGSSSPEEDDDNDNDDGDKDFLTDRIRCETESKGTQEPVGSKVTLSNSENREDSSAFNLPVSLAGASCHGGAIPKQQSSVGGLDRKDTVPLSDERELRILLDARDASTRLDNCRETFDARANAGKDFLREPTREGPMSMELEDQAPYKGDHPQKENTQPEQPPGYGFFCDEIDGIEDIIERIISEEEGEEAGISHRGFGLDNQMMDNFLSDGDLQSEIAELRKSIDECNYDSEEDTHFYDDDETDELHKQMVTYGNRAYRRHQTSDKRDNGEGSEEGEEDSWSCVPKILLEDIFTLLTPKDRHQASQVCRQWYDLFYSPRVWETFILLEKTLTKKRFNLYKGYQRELCPWKTQLCLRRVGSFFKRIVITPITDYFNLCEFLRILAAFLQYQEEHGQNAMPLLHTFDFTFACATRGEDGVMVHGTGGQILDMIVKLLIQMSGLKHLKVNQLLTDVTEVPDLFSALTGCFRESLNSLEMLNVTKIPYALTYLSRFENLIKLTISPQHLNDEVLVLLAGLNLLHLHLIQDVYTCECQSVSWEAWKLLKEMAPWLRVYLEISGIVRSQLLIQPRAPVYGVFLRTPFSRLTNDLLTELVEQYGKTLRYLVQERLPRIHGPRNFDKRCDSSLLYLVRRCPHLHTLVVSERISTATLILIANDASNLNTLLVRQNALIKRCDWPSRGEWSRDFYRRLKTCALDYDKCTNEICTLMRHRWRPLSDKQFMRLKIVPKVEIF